MIGDFCQSVVAAVIMPNFGWTHGSSPWRLVMGSEKEAVQFQATGVVYWGKRESIPQHHTYHQIDRKRRSRPAAVVRWHLWASKSQLRRPESRVAEGARNVPARTGVVAPWCSQLLGAWLGADHWGLS